MITILSSILMAFIMLLVLYGRGKAFMKFYQQEEYESPRFLNWVSENKAYDRSASLILIIATAVMVFTDMVHVASGITILGLIAGFVMSRMAMKGAKKPLVMTARVKRILTTYLLVNLIVLVTIYFVSDSFLRDFSIIAFALLQLAPITLVVGKTLLDPNERRVQAKFKAEADARFAELAPRVVGITGSFGKTSTKHILHHILSSAQPTLATPGSVNTIMGITRVIREQLKPEHHFFIVEMGAYGPGSIERLAAFTPPDVGLITAIGSAHYERFKSLETVAVAKFELAENVTKRGGKMVINSDGMDEALMNERISAIPGDYMIVGEGHPFHLQSVKMDAEGTHIDLMDENGETQSLLVPLYGQHQAENTLLAVATARALGVPWSIVRASMRTMPQIKHRVEVTKEPNQPISINDAYNSNPIGFAAALDVLDVLKRNGKRYLITPGMVELGETHDLEHSKLGAMAANKADVILAVTPDRIPTFVEAAKNGSAEVRCFDTQDEAQNWLNSHITAADVVLYENNLPDLYEAKVSF